MPPRSESATPAICAAVRGDPFVVIMLSLLFPALLTNCGHTRCPSHVGTEGLAESKSTFDYWTGSRARERVVRRARFNGKTFKTASLPFAVLPSELRWQ